MAQLNGQPRLDGEWTLYTPDNGIVYSAHESLIFVNGMANTGADHAKAGKAIANLACHDVMGIYNQTANGDDHYLKVAATRLESDPMARAVVREILVAMNLTPAFAADAMAGWSLKLQAKLLKAGGTLAGFLGDVSQCGEDWMIAALVGSVVNEETSIPSGATAFAAPALVSFKLLHQLQKVPKLTVDQRMRLARSVFLQGNPATRSLFDKLTELTVSPTSRVRIVCHSQGNLITANALTALCWARGPGPVSRVSVYSLASPVPPSGWPSAFGFVVRFFAHVGDLVGWLSLNKSYTGHGGTAASPSLRMGHAIEGYLELPEFIRVLRHDLRVPQPAPQPKAQAA